MFKQMIRDYRRKHRPYPDVEMKLFAQYKSETKQDAINKNNEITVGFRMWRKEFELKQEKEILDDPSIEKLEVTEAESNIRILTEIYIDLDMIFNDIRKWIKKKCDSALFYEFLDFMKEKFKACKQITPSNIDKF